MREYDSVGDIANVSFTYDARGRLTQETRTGTSPYNLAYAYDQGGNRTSKFDVLADVKTYYYYDIDITGYSASENNRLMYYEVYEDASSTPVLASTTYYYYNIMGNPIRVLTETEVTVGQDKEYMYEATRMVYARNGQAVTYAIGETYDPRETPSYSFEYAKEFRYDGARQRYLVRELNANMALISETWSDYDGSSIYGSYSVTSGTANELMSYAPGIGQVDTSLATPVSKYYHADMIGTTKLLTDGISAATSGGSVLTAFGEHVAGSTHRYGYAGAYGYQTDDGSSDAFPFMHVGHRYYDPSTGRFLQRDPIGIDGGLNVYEYAHSNPVTLVDSAGTAVKHVRGCPGGPFAPGGGTGKYPKGKNGWSKSKERIRPSKSKSPKRTPKRWWRGARMARVPLGPAAACVGVAAVASAAGLAYYYYVIKPGYDDDYDKESAPYDTPFDGADPWGWVQPGSSWEAQRDKWRATH